GGPSFPGSSTNVWQNLGPDRDPGIGTPGYAGLAQTMVKVWGADGNRNPETEEQDGGISPHRRRAGKKRSYRQTMPAGHRLGTAHRLRGNPAVLAHPESPVLRIC